MCLGDGMPPEDTSSRTWKAEIDKLTEYRYVLVIKNMFSKEVSKKF